MTPKRSDPGHDPDRASGEGTLIRYGGIASILMICANAAHAASFCDMAMDLADRGNGAHAALPAPSDLQSAPCTQAIVLGVGLETSCYWSFDYREPAAVAAFEAIITALTECLGPDAKRASDLGVNHPDSYDLRLFDSADRQFAVSLKDKAALQQTLVFLRTATTP